MCTRCLRKYFSLCLDNRQLPLCPLPHCRHHYKLSRLSRYLSEKHLKVYKKAIFSYYEQVKDGEVEHQLTRLNLLEQMQNDRIDFIKQNFPRGVYKVAMLAIPHKVKDIKRIKEMIGRLEDGRSYFISCRVTGCDGALDQKLVCNLCTARFCGDCDQLIGSTGQHECKKEDLESATELRKIIKCPKCRAPIVKSEGCNGMTCAKCKTVFDYATGEKANHGSSNFKVKDEIPSFFDSISDLVLKSRKPKLFGRLIREIESEKPPAPSDQNIATTLFEVKSGVCEVDEAVNIIAKYFEKYNEELVVYRAYIAHLNEIENALREGNLTSTLLHRIWDIYCE